jgi:cell division protein FtsW (lipid II flippase)
VDNWRDPWSDPFIAGYQQIQAEYALASGGIFGVGPGRGSPWLIPEVHTDYVIAAIGEEFGFVGIVTVVALYLMLASRGLVIARGTESTFHSLLAIGLAAGLAIQGIIIMAGVLRLMPLTGVTLPLVSYGGTSIIVTSISIGMLMRISSRQSGPSRSRIRSRMLQRVVRSGAGRASH